MSFLQRYLEMAPSALAIERSIECELMAGQSFTKPILDLGCGDGVFASILFEEKIDSGLDLDQSEIDCAKKLDIYSELIVGPAHKIPKPDNSFETVFSNSVLEHIENLEPVLEEIHRVMKPQGRLYITVPTDTLEKSTVIYRLLLLFGLKRQMVRYASFYNSFWKHFHAYDIETWQTKLEATGLVVDSYTPYAPKNFSTFYDALIPLAIPSWGSKKLLNRWIFMPALRRLLTPAIYWILKNSIMRLEDSEGGSLVMFVLKK